MKSRIIVGLLSIGMSFSVCSEIRNKEEVSLLQSETARYLAICNENPLFDPTDLETKKNDPESVQTYLDNDENKQLEGGFLHSQMAIRKAVVAHKENK